MGSDQFTKHAGEKRSGLGSQNSTWSKQQPMEFQTNKVGFMNKHEDNYRTYSDLFWHTQAGHSSGILPQTGHWFAAPQKRQMKWLSTDQTKDLRDRYADCSDGKPGESTNGDDWTAKDPRKSGFQTVDTSYGLMVHAESTNWWPG